MGKVIEPVHTAAVGLGNVRFFRALLPGPHLIWFAYEDLLIAAGLARPMRRGFEAMLKRDYRDAVKPVMTPDGPATLAPHYLAQGFVDAMEEVGQVPAGFAMAYTRAAADAMGAVTRSLGLSGLDAINHTVAAYRNSNGIEGPHPTIQGGDVDAP